MHCLGHYQGGQQGQEHQGKYPEEAVLRYGKMGDELPVDYTVAYPGHEIGGEGQVGNFVYEPGEQGGQAAQVQGVKQGEEQHCENIYLIVFIMHALIAQGLPPEEELVEETEGGKKGNHGQGQRARLFFAQKFSEESPGKVIAYGVELGPPQGVDMYKSVQQGRQYGQGEEAEDQDQLLVSAGAAMVHHVQEGHHKKEPAVEQHVPGVAVYLIVHKSTQHVSRAHEIVQV